MKIDYAAQCRFFTAEDAVRIALQAYYAASRDMDPPAGEPWMLDGQPYATATDFAETFSGQMQARMGLVALDRLGTFLTVNSPWVLHQVAARIEPEKMAPIVAAREMEKADIEREILGDSMHGLPVEIISANMHESSGDNRRG